MLRVNQEDEKCSNNISKINSTSTHINQKIKSNPMETEEDNSTKRSVFRNAGKELLDSYRYTTEESNPKNTSVQSIIWRHKGIKRKGHSLYDPYLIQVCKNAIIREKNELPNYKEIIQSINTEYGIEDKNEKRLKNNNYDIPYISTSNNTSNYLKDLNYSALSTNINDKR
jgi:hypothetical protein